MCFGCCDEPGMSQTIWSSPPQENVFVQNQTIYPGGGMGETIISQPSYGTSFMDGGGMGTTVMSSNSYDGLGTTVMSSPSYDGGMGTTVMSSPSYDGGMGTTVMSSPSDQGGNQMGTTVYSQSSY